MLKTDFSHIRVYLFLAILGLLIVIGCAAKKEFWGDPKTGLILQYRMDEAQVLKYQSSSDFIQTLEVMGNTMEVESDQMGTYSFTLKGEQEGQYNLGVTIDAMSLSIFSPQGEFSADMGEIIGKSFDMTVSMLGKEQDLTGVDDLQYDMASEGKRSIRSEFENFFPDLAEKPLKIGDTWTTQWNIVEKSGSGEARFEFESVNTLEGYETIEGLDCAKITATLQGTLEGEGEQQGMDLVSQADIEGSTIWYFAYKKGVFISAKTTGTGEGTITASGAQNMTIPMVREFEIEVKLVK